MLAMETFPHGGEHLDNDDQQAHVTLALLAAFVIVLSFLVVLAVFG